VSDSIEINDNSAITIPLRNLIAIGIGLTLFMAQFFLITSRISTLEEDNRRHTDEINKATQFRYQWSRGELGLIGIDIEQNIRLDHIENALLVLKNEIEKHAEQDDEHN
jgi:hypothetical protein